MSGSGEVAAIMKKSSPGSVRRAFQPWNDPAAKPLVEFRGVTRRFGEVTAVSDLSLSLYPREFFALHGPSGCGKTTLMRMLAGFETPDEGTILLDGQDISRRSAASAARQHDVPVLRAVPPSERRRQHRLWPEARGAAAC